MSTTADNIKIFPLSFPWRTADPFLFCAHHEDHYPAGNEVMGPSTSLKGRNIGNDFEIRDGFRMYHGESVPGFPAHPHRGFETVTIALQGFVDHSDSLGAAGRFGRGDIQWMTAGKGVQHSEMFPLISSDSGNTLEIFQIWLNLPMKSKKVEPHFAMFWAENIPRLEFEGGKVGIRLIAGELSGKSALQPPPHSWAADRNNDVAIWLISMDTKSSWKLPAASPDLSRTLYFFKGDGLEISGTAMPAYHAAELRSDIGYDLTSKSGRVEMLLLQGRAIKEPVVQYGPFVVNYEHEIRETMMDFGKTQFGGWPWPRTDNVHERTRGRFAKHADGRLEELKS